MNRKKDREITREAANRGVSITRRAFLAGSAASALIIFGAVSTLHAEKGANVRVGFIVPETGPDAQTARSLQAGFSLFLKENSVPGVSLEALTKTLADEDANIAECLTDMIINKQVGFLVCPPSLQSSEKLLRGLVGTRPIVFITNPSVRLVAGELCIPTAFRVGPNCYQAARPLAPWAVETLGLRGFLTGQDDAESNEEADAFAQGFERSGGMFVDRVMVSPSATDFAPVLEAIEQSKPDFVFGAFRDEMAAGFLKAFRDKPSLKQPVIGPDALTAYPRTLRSVGRNGQGVRTLSCLLDPKAFAERIKTSLDLDVSDASTAAQGYDIAAIISQVVAKAPEESDTAGLAALVKQVQWEGPRGKIYFDDNHEPVLHTMVQEWSVAGDGFSREIKANLGECRSVDFGCGRVGFPRSRDIEIKEEGAPGAAEGEIILEEENN